VFQIGLKWFLFFFCLFTPDTGSFCSQVLAVLKMENHGFGHQADLIIAEPYTATFSLTLHSPKKMEAARRPKADARPKIAPKSQKTN
jgi:hypothetical protein